MDPHAQYYQNDMQNTYYNDVDPSLQPQLAGYDQQFPQEAYQNENNGMNMPPQVGGQHDMQFSVPRTHQQSPQQSESMTNQTFSTSPNQPISIQSGNGYSTQESLNLFGDQTLNYVDDVNNNIQQYIQPEKQMFQRGGKSKKIRKSNRKPPTKCNTVEEFLQTVDRKFVPDEFLDPNLDEETRKKMMTKIRNRQAAQKSRDKKNLHVNDLQVNKSNLETQVQDLSNKNKQLTHVLIQLQDANDKLLNDYKSLQYQHESYVKNSQAEISDLKQKYQQLSQQQQYMQQQPPTTNEQYAYEPEFGYENTNFGYENYVTTQEQDIYRGVPKMSGNTLRSTTLGVLCMICTIANVQFGQRVEGNYHVDFFNAQRSEGKVCLNPPCSTGDHVEPDSQGGKNHTIKNSTLTPRITDFVPLKSALHISFSIWAIFAVFLFLLF